MKTTISLLLASVLLTAFVVSDPISIDGYSIHRIRISGNRSFSAGELSNLTTLHGTSAFKRNILRREAMRFSSLEAKNDLIQIIRFYQREGFLFATAKITDTVANASDSSVSFTITIEEGPPIIVESVHFSYNDSLSIDKPRGHADPIEIQPDLKLKRGERFRDADVLSDLMVISNHFRNLGFPYVKCKPLITINKGARSASVEWSLNPGIFAHFKDVTVSGNDRVPASLVLDQLAFKTGDQYSAEKLDDTQHHIYELGMFRRVIVDAALTDSSSNEIPVNILVREAPRFSLKFGAGYSREERIRGVVEGGWLGFTGGARQLNMRLRSSRLEPYRVRLTLTEPHFFVPRLGSRLGLSGRQEDEPGYKTRRGGLDFWLYWHLHDNIIASVGYIAELVNRQDDGGEIELYQSEAFDSLYNISGPEIGLTFDNSSPLFKPDRGMMLTASYKINGAFLSASDYRFTRLITECRYYRSLAGAVFAQRLKLGRIISKNDHGLVPVEERFFAGGITSVRGWSRQQLGPKDANGKPIGGKSLLEGSSELRFTLLHDLRRIGNVLGLLFLDYGNVWVEENTYRLNELGFAAGFGIGIDTPIGPVCLDWARPIFEEGNPGWLWNLSIGYTF